MKQYMVITEYYKMIEVEVKLKIDNRTSVEEQLKDHGFCLHKRVKETDTYFDGGLYGIKKSGQALRVRKTVDYMTGVEKSELNFKGAKIDTVSMARLELETEVENGDVAMKILEVIGFHKAEPRVIKERWLMSRDDLHACLDEVEGLGSFLELEIMVEDEGNRPEALGRIEEILEKLGYTMKDTTRVSYLGQLQGRNF